MSRPAVGTRLAGRYEIRAVTADRPTGVLYRGFDEQIGVEVALRLIDDELLVDEDERRAFVQKASRARPLQHPNLMRLYDVLVDDASVVLVMQWAPGERLARRLREGNPPDREEARRILRRAAAGIAHAHQHGIVLGNVRPDTVILYGDELKLTNVGIGPALPRARFVAAMQHRGETEGLAPELIAGKPIDARADVFGLASMARTLFTSPDTAITPTIAPVLARALVEDPATRPRDAEAFVRELEAALDGRSPARSSGVTVSTIRDTEPVPRIPAEPLAFTRPEVRRAMEGVTSPGAAPVMTIEAAEPTPEEMAPARSDADAELTGRHQRIDESGRVVELDLHELVEVPTEPADPPAPAVDERAETRVVKTPVRNVVPTAIARRISPVRDPEDDAATRPVQKLGPSDVELERMRLPPPLPVAQSLPPQPLYQERPPDHGRALLALVVVSMSLGVFGAGALWRFTQGLRAAQPLSVVVPIAAPPPIAPQIAPPPIAPRTPAPPAAPPPRSGPCPLGMALLTGARPYCIDQYEYPGGHTVPRTHISLADAEHVCESRGLRLCSDPEWEAACRGPSGASYPYGQSFDPQRCNVAGHGGAIEEAGTRTRCRSAAGAFDMSGNVSEWTASGNQRGGSSRSPTTFARCSHVVRGADLAGAEDVGFRCCGAATP